MPDTTPASGDGRRTAWPTAEPLQQAADLRRAAGDPLLADWLDATANALAWLAPYRDNEPGYGMWEAALAVARQLLGTTEGAGEPVCAMPGFVDCGCDHVTGCQHPAAPPAPADRAAVCICGHPEQQHFEDVCQTCDCGDYIEPRDAREVIARWRQAALATRDLRRATTLREAAAVAAAHQSDCQNCAVELEVAASLRRLAGEAAAGVQQPTESEARTRIADALADADGWKWAPGFKNSSPSYQEYLRQADVALTALTTPLAAPAVPEEPTP